jgi:hypothetical protein
MPVAASDGRPAGTAATWYRSAMPRPGPRPPRAAPWIGALAVGLLLGGCSSTPGAGPTYACKTPPSDLSACTTDADCATVEVGCYCGPQPVNGVAVKYAQAAQSCEDAAASACELGCLNELALKTQDGKKAALGTRVAARCDHAGVSGTCTSYLP